MKNSSNKYGYKKSEDLDELWNETAGTITCPKCGSYGLYGHITEIKNGLALVEWTCKEKRCRHRWSSRCPFEDGLLIVDE